VNALVGLLGLAQPQVSKHLRVLRQVGLVEVRDEGRQRLYRLQGQSLKPIHDWVKNFEQSWNERFEALDATVQHRPECLNEPRAGRDRCPVCPRLRGCADAPVRAPGRH
jgi:DNA-binding transcriptional ArsR family regulator